MRWIAVAAVLALAGCGSDDKGDSGTSTPASGGGGAAAASSSLDLSAPAEGSL
jgi:hypothetical protein